MNLPNYFLADLPPEASLSATMVNEACQTLKRNRERYLAIHSTRSIIKVISSLAKTWLEPAYPFRKLALEQAPATLGFSGPTLAAGLDSFFEQLTDENLQVLVEQDLGHAQRLDEMAATNVEPNADRAAIV